jgi:hypothetical protein
MTDKEFCKIDTEFYGEVVDNIKQIKLRSFDGEELKEYVEHCIKLNLLTIPVVVKSLPNKERLCNCFSNKQKIDCGFECYNK